MNANERQQLLDHLFTSRAQLTAAIDQVTAMTPCPDTGALMPDPTSPDIVPDIPDPSPDTPDLHGKVALLVGHNERGNQGAWTKGPEIRESEFVFYNKIADKMIELGLENVEFEKFNRTYGGGYTAEINRVYKAIDVFDPTLVIDMHFNGGGGDYSMVMYHHASKVSRRCADAMSVPFAQKFKARNYNLTEGKDSVTELSSGENGYYSMARAKCPSVLLEPFFGDNKEHSAIVDELGHEGYAKLCLIATAFGLNSIYSN